MKLRIRDNSLRFRLTQSEVDTLRMRGIVKSTVNFPGGAKIDYVVEGVSSDVDATAIFAKNRIELRIPKATVNEWADSNQVSIKSDETLDDDNVLTLLLEKDFACLAPREGEDESDMFPHQNDGQETC
jgi:hypothetical protein